MVDNAYYELCMDGNFDIALLILQRYQGKPGFNIDFNFHSRCILDHSNGIDHYEYCRRNNIEINYNGMSPSYTVLDTFPPHPEMNTLGLKIHHILHIMFPNMEKRDYYNPPTREQITQLRIILKDRLHLRCRQSASADCLFLNHRWLQQVKSAKGTFELRTPHFTMNDIIDNKVNICYYMHTINMYDFFVYIIKNMDPSDVDKIIRTLYKHNDYVLRYKTFDILRILVKQALVNQELGSNNYIQLVDYLLSNIVINNKYYINIGKPWRIFTQRTIKNIYL